MNDCLQHPVCDWYKGEHSIVCANSRKDKASFTLDEVREIVREEMTNRYHPEFGSEWREDGEIGRAIRSAQRLAWQSGYASGWSNASRRLTDEPDAPITPNPFEDDNE